MLFIKGKSRTFMHNNDGLRLSKTESRHPVGFVISHENNEDEILIETSGLQRQNFNSDIVLPDGTQPLILSSGYISGILGHGGAAVLYEIRNKELGFYRAVKLLRPNHNEESLNRFLKEFKVCSQLSHPNIPVVHTVGRWYGLPFIEMEKVTGFSLLEMITKFAPLPVALVTAIGISICKALDYIHHCKYEIDSKHYSGFLHLDLKPSNIMLADIGLLKILDFGMATPIQDAREGLLPDSSIGTSQYIAPEILFSKSVPDARSDLFSLGCILYELVTGNRVFNGSSPDEIMRMRKRHLVPSLKKIDKNVPDQLARIIDRCLSFDKTHRPDDALSVKLQLEKIHYRHTRDSADDIIALYTSKRKYNEPFVIPPPHQKAPAVFQYVGITAGLLFVALIVLNLFVKRDDLANFKFSVQKSLNSVFPFIPVDTSLLFKERNNKLITEIVDSFQLADFLVSDAFFQDTADFGYPDIVKSLKSKWINHEYDALKAYVLTIPEKFAKRKEVILYTLRSSSSGDAEFVNALDAVTLNDGEYYFHTARYMLSQKRYAEALGCLYKAEELPSELIDKKSLGLEVFRYKARILTAIFRDNPQTENLVAAVNAWEKLLLILKDSPNSPQAQEAFKEKENLASEATWRGISFN
jgi:serine/threonine protein kinase